MFFRHQVAKPRGFDRARAHHVDADPTALQIQRPGAGKVAHGGLARAVDAKVCRPLNGHRRAGQNNRGSGGEQRQRLLHREQHPADVSAENPVKLLFGYRAQRQHIAATRIGEQNIEAAFFFGYPGIDLVQVRQF